MRLLRWSAAGGLLGIWLASVLVAPAAAQPWGPPGYYGYRWGPPPYPYYRRGYAYGPPPAYDEDDVPPPPPRGIPNRGDAVPNGPRMPLPVARIEERVAAAGMRLIAKPRHNGRIYFAVGEDRHGRRRRLVFDAFSGALIENKPLGAKSAAPAGLSDVKPPTDTPKTSVATAPPPEAKAKRTDPLALPPGPAPDDAPPSGTQR